MEQRERNKLFFLWGQEYVRYRQDGSSTQTVPSLAMRQGDFSQLLHTNPFIAAGIALKDPTSATPFPGNIIPHDRLSPNGIGLLNAYRLPQGNFQSGFNWLGMASAWQNTTKNTISVDFNPRDKHQFRLRSLIYVSNRYMPFDTTTNAPAPTYRHIPMKTVSVNYVWTINHRRLVRAVRRERQ